MKRILLVVVILVAASTMVSAQQSRTAVSKQEMDAYLDRVKENSSKFDSMLSDIKERNGSSAGAYTFNRLKSEIDSLASRIQSEGASISATHDRGNKVSSETVDRVERMINQHKKKEGELQELLSK